MGEVTMDTFRTFGTYSPETVEAPGPERAEKAAGLIKVAASSRTTAVAGCIAGVVRERGQVDVRAIGAGAVNQATKAAAIARGYLELDGIDIVIVPSFTEVMIDGHEKTAVCLSVEERGQKRSNEPD
jgi:stage V sporulation protein S